MRITLLNVSGQEMAMIADDRPKAGEYMAEIDISNWPTGVYGCRVQMGRAAVTGKIVKR